MARVPNLNSNIVKILAHNEYYRSPKRTEAKSKRDFIRGYLAAINEVNHVREKFTADCDRYVVDEIIKYLCRNGDQR